MSFDYRNGKFSSARTSKAGFVDLFEREGSNAHHIGTLISGSRNLPRFADDCRAIVDGLAANASRPAFYMAELATRKFNFHAFGTTEDEAREALRKGLIHHLRPDLSDALAPEGSGLSMIADMLEDANLYPCEMGAVYRDGEQIR